MASISPAGVRTRRPRIAKPSRWSAQQASRSASKPTDACVMIRPWLFVRMGEVLGSCMVCKGWQNVKIWVGALAVVLTPTISLGAPHMMVVAANKLAAEAGLDVLRQGGTAVDAAVA